MAIDVIAAAVFLLALVILVSKASRPGRDGLLALVVLGEICGTRIIQEITPTALLEDLSVQVIFVFTAWLCWHVGTVRAKSVACVYGFLSFYQALMIAETQYPAGYVSAYLQNADFLVNIVATIIILLVVVGGRMAVLANRIAGIVRGDRGRYQHPQKR